MGSSTVLLRIMRRNTSFEDEPAEIVKAEFLTREGEPDLHLSVYEIVPNHVVRVVCEHSAAVNLQKPCFPRNHPDLTGLFGGVPSATPGAEDFALTRDSHRELDFSSCRELVSLAVGLKNCRAFCFTKKQAKTYIRDRFEADDAEWMAFLQHHANGRRYLRFIGVGG